MNAHGLAADPPATDEAACCAHCRKPLPAVNGQLQPWRAPSGLFFCNEFCADDAEEASFQKHLGGLAATVNART
jgi:hypothetical protein